MTQKEKKKELVCEQEKALLQEVAQSAFCKAEDTEHYVQPKSETKEKG